MKNFIQSIVEEHKKLLDFESRNALIPQAEKLLAEIDDQEQEGSLLAEIVKFKSISVRWEVGASQFSCLFYIWLGDASQAELLDMPAKAEEFPVSWQALRNAMQKAGWVSSFVKQQEEDSSPYCQLGKLVAVKEVEAGYYLHLASEFTRIAPE